MILRNKEEVVRLPVVLHLPTRRCSNGLLTTVRPGCGCTAADYTKTPIAPKKKDGIDVIFDPYNRPGGFTKTLEFTPMNLS